MQQPIDIARYPLNKAVGASGYLDPLIFTQVKAVLQRYIARWHDVTAQRRITTRGQDELSPGSTRLLTALRAHSSVRNVACADVEV